MIIYDLDFYKFRTKDYVLNHFRPRLPWHPHYGEEDLNTYFVDWENTHGNEFIIGFGDLRLSIQEAGILHPGFGFTGAELVGRKSFQTGRFGVLADMNPVSGVVPAIWFLTQTRFIKGRESIKPEFDSHEFGTKNNPGFMSVSLHNDLSYPTRKLKTKHFLPPDGEHLYWAEITDKWFISGVDDQELTRFRRSCKYYLRQPMYPIIWLAAPTWGGFEGDFHQISIKRIKLEV